MTGMVGVTKGVVSLSKNASVRQAAVLIVDALIAALSLWLAMILRFEGRIPTRYLEALPLLIVLLVSSRLLANILFRLHRWSFLFSGLSDAVRIATAGLLGTGIFMSLIYMLRVFNPPRATVALEFFISVALMAMARFSPRLAGMYLADQARARTGGTRTLIVGAGAAGEMLQRDLRRRGLHDYIVIGFVDDDPSKRGLIVGGKPVFGDIDDLHTLIQQYRIDTVLLAIPSLPARRIRDILSHCADLKVQFKILPFSYVFLEKRVTSSMLNDLSPEDLLPRAPIAFSETGVSSMVAGRRVLVTGAAGSIGSEICRQLLGAKVGTLVMVDLNENGLYLGRRRLETEFPDTKIECEVANIRDVARVDRLFAKYAPQDVFHAAAHKHVPLMEIAPCEAIKNNILGTRTVCSLAAKHGADRFVLISTDKAVRPTSVMGASKRVAEMLVRQLLAGGETEFCAVRFGNVLGSAGSVVPLFSQQIEAGGPVTVTHPEVRRYFMTIAEAVGLVLTAAYKNFGELCVLDMGEQIPILDLARHMITISGRVPEVDIPIEFTGLRPGEKLFEELLTEEEESTFKVHEKIFVAKSPKPPANIVEAVDELERLAADENATEVVRRLIDLVPSFKATVEA